MMTESISLDVIGFLEGTTKSSVWVDFLRHYERHLREFRDKEIQILEIGILGGASLKMWKRYFPKATLIGVDIKEGCRQYATDRVIIEIGSQYDPEFLAELARKYHPTIIIDDGSHLAHHVPYTFERLFPILPPGGLYVIEDLFFHLGPEAAKWRGPAKSTPPEYLTDLARLLLTEAPDFSNESGNWPYFRSHIDEIAFVPNGAAFIRKRENVQARNAERFAEAERYANQSEQAVYWNRLVSFIRRNGGSLDQALKAARKAVELGPDGADNHVVLSQVLFASGKLDEALKSAQTAAILEPKTARTWDQLGQVQAARRDYKAAEESLRKAFALARSDFAITSRLADVLEQKQDRAGAKSVLTGALAQNPPPNWSTRFKRSLDRLAAS